MHRIALTWRAAPFPRSRLKRSLDNSRFPTVRAMTRQRTLAIVALLAASVLCIATVEIRTHETGDAYYRFLVWNLILAWVPLAFAIAAYSRARSRIDLPVAVLLVPWLLFFPNAPYLLTDFIHLGEGPAPLWYDGLMFSAFAWTGLLLGFGSLYLVQMITSREVGGLLSTRPRADGQVEARPSQPPALAAE